MIKLISLLENLVEAKKFNLDKIEDAAEYIIRATWQFMPREDRFSSFQFFLWMDNDERLMRQVEMFAKKFFPNEQYPEDKFTNFIEDRLEEMEKEKQERMTKKINTLDPLFFLKQIVRGKTYEGAKQTLMSNSLGSWGYRGGRIGDTEAENVFNRMYKNAMGETVYDEKRANQYGRLSDLVKTPIVGRAEDNIKQYSVNMFIDYNTGYKMDRFPAKVKIYRGAHSPTAKIRPGDYVTFDKEYAGSYTRGKFGSIISDIVDSKDLYVYEVEPGRSELVYWPEGHQIHKYEGNIPTFKEFWKEVNSL